MPSCTDFLTGLAPAMDLTGDVTDCIICHNSFTDPVLLPCSHIFDRPCITEWLEGQCKCTCPYCRKELFTLPEQETAQAEGLQIPIAAARSAVRLGMVRRALRLSGLQGSRSQQRTALDGFGFGAFSEADIYAASVSVAHYIFRGRGGTDQGELSVNTSDGHRQVVRGTAVFDVTETLRARVIALAHLIPALSSVRGLPYPPQAQHDWTRLVNVLRMVFEKKHGDECDLKELTEDLRNEVTQELAEMWPRYQIETPFLRTHEEMRGLNLFRLHFDHLLHFISYLIWQEEHAHEL